MSNKTAKIAEIKNLSFEDALKKLEDIVSLMEDSDTSLDNSIANYEYGIALKKYLEQHLEQAKLKIAKITELDS
ncbi:MAG: exodeoxyribonuclease VII small subunit [Alphaproteobacteria bacterium]|jgi:exodeoxyribonuclease VII small subunit|nr:exodeoxyribonuclease VII small subunit [Alphaproteobacteria bacterium]MBT5828394.1 exodeoxyribonuclease VII small subunit [Alphaproteobacteria bacterium]